MPPEEYRLDGCQLSQREFMFYDLRIRKLRLLRLCSSVGGEKGSKPG